MSPRRITAAAALLLGAIALAPTTSPAPAAGAPDGLTAAQIAALTPEKLKRGHAWIQGVVSDQFGDRLGNVVVEATSAESDGAAITYEEPGIAGSTGFYRIYDLTPGTYRLRFSSDDPRIKPQTATVTVGNREIGKVDAQVTRVLAETRLTAALRKKSVTTKQSGTLEVTLTTAATKKPTGTVEVREGNRVVGEGLLRAADGGGITIVLDRLGKGDHLLKAHYLGSSTLKASSSKAVTLTVTRPRH